MWLCPDCVDDLSSDSDNYGEESSELDTEAIALALFMMNN